MVLSDLGAIRRLYNVHHVAATPKDAVCMAIRSGVDMQFYDFDHDVFQKALMDCLHEGTLPKADLDRAVRSVLRVKFALGLFDHPFVDPVAETEGVSVAGASRCLVGVGSRVDDPAQERKPSAAAFEVGPADRGDRPNADVARYGDYEKEANGEHISLLAGETRMVPQATVDFDEGKDISCRCAKAKAADVVILGLGEWQGISGEGLIARSWTCRGSRSNCLKLLRRRASRWCWCSRTDGRLTIGWAKQHVPAMLEAWYPGEFGGKAIAETLFGDNNPAGRLTITFPRSVGQLPDFYNFDPSRMHKYVDDDGKPLFPFGFGLSYTTFRYDHLTVQAPEHGSKADVMVSVEVTNTGDKQGTRWLSFMCERKWAAWKLPSALEGILPNRAQAA